MMELVCVVQMAKQYQFQQSSRLLHNSNMVAFRRLKKEINTKLLVYFLN